MKARSAHNPLSQLENKYPSSFTDFMEASNIVASCAAPNTVTLRFANARSAQLVFNFVVERLPLQKTEFPKLDEGELTLSSEQFLYCERQAMCESGRLSTDYLADCLLKTLRADEFDFSYQFILGIIPGENNSRRLHNLRPFQRKPFLIAPDGTIQAREDKQPMYSREKKIGFSQAQSNTLLDPNATSRAFGFSRYGRSDKLYGIVTHSGDALLNRLLTDDSGTVSRIFDFDTAALAENGLSYLEGCLYTTNQLEEFKAAKNKFRLLNSRTNEVLARIRFNPYRSVVCICSDTLEARLLAYDFARELLDHYKIYAEQHGLTVNPDFKIPIISYIKKNIFHGLFSGVYHDIRQYTNKMRKQDEAEAISIYTDLDERIRRYKNNDFEFLLGLPEITHEMLFDTCLGEPLAFVMLYNGYTRMLMRLLTKPSLRDRVFRTLTDRYLGLFKINDPIIASLVLAEQFDLADKLINATVSHKHKIQIECSEYHNNLLTYLLYKGNPRQIQYIGLDDILLLAADRHLWVTAKLCLKELSNIKQWTLKSLFSKALSYRKAYELKFLSQKIDEVDAIFIQLFNLAVDQKQWEYVLSLTSKPVILGNKPLLGRALIEAIKNKQVITARVLIEKGALPEKQEYHTHFIEGVLYHTLNNQLFELIPDAIKAESNYKDDDLQIRYVVALYLAYEWQNSSTISCLESLNGYADSYHPKCIKTAILHLVFKALSDDNFELAKTRLIRLCQHCQLQPTDNHSINDTLDIVMQDYDVGVVLSDDKRAWAFELLLKKGFLNASATLLRHSKIKESYLALCIGVLIEYPQFIQAMAPSLVNKITPEQVRRLSLLSFIVEKESVIAFLKLVKDSLIDNKRYVWDFYPAFVFCPFSETLEIEKQLMRLLNPSIIRHMLLIFVIDRFWCHLKPFKDSIDKQTNDWPNLSKTFLTHGVLKEYLRHEVKDTIDPQQGEILSILNHYFSDIDVIPADEIIEATYAKVLELFELSSGSDKQDINTKILTHMKNLNRELSISHQSSCQQEVSLPCPDQNIDSNLDDREFSYLY